MQRVISGILGFFIAFLVSTAPAGAITNGTPAGAAYPYVGVVIGNGLCSGTLISPTMMLTAGHCTVGISEVRVAFATEIWDLNGEVTGTAHTHPNFCYGCAPGLGGTASYDVGVITFAQPISMNAYGMLPEAGQVNALGKHASLTAVGYGVQGFIRGGGPPQGDGAGVRNYATVSMINNNHKLADMFLKHSSIQGQNGGGVCAGDSGGPILAADQVTVLAVTSFGGGNCHSNAYAQRIDRQDVLDWILSLP